MDNDKDLIRLGNNIKRLRLLNNWTQDELAERCGYKSETRKSTIQKIESGKSNLPATKILVFSNVFQTTPSRLLLDDNDSPSSLVLSDIERNVILAYRNADSDDQRLVRKVLGIDEKKVELSEDQAM